MGKRDAAAARANGAAIIRLRHRKGWTRKELAEESGVSTSTLGRAENSKRVSLNNLAEIAEALGTQPGEIQTNDGVSASSKETTHLPSEDRRAVRFVPPLPDLVIGRESAFLELKLRLGVTSRDGAGGCESRTVAMQGLPGVGKSTVAAALSHDRDIDQAFCHGTLWASLGPDPDLLSVLVEWGHALGDEGVLRAKNTSEASRRLANSLDGKQMLLIVDDIWEVEHAAPFRVGGPTTSLLATTRLPRVAQALLSRPELAYNLPVLAEDHSLQLLEALAPSAVQRHPDQSRELVRELEGLPLALQVAGRLLNAESTMGWGMAELLSELREATSILQATAPADCTDVASQATPTVFALLQKSTDRLAPQVRELFAMLGPFAPKPATFDLESVVAVWQTDDARGAIRELVARGLIEPMGESRFRIHALLVAHARALLDELK